MNLNNHKQCYSNGTYFRCHGFSKIEQSTVLFTISLGIYYIVKIFGSVWPNHIPFDKISYRLFCNTKLIGFLVVITLINITKKFHCLYQWNRINRWKCIYNMNIILYLQLVYWPGIVGIKHIIEDDQNFVCMVLVNKFYHGPVQDEYLNSYKFFLLYLNSYT